MISAVVFVPDHEKQAVLSGDQDTVERIVRSFVWLVSAVVRGVVQDVRLAGPDVGILHDVADQAGCDFIGGERETEWLSRAVAACKYPRVLVIAAGYQPPDAIFNELERFFRTPPRGGTVRLLSSPTTFWQRLFPDGARTVGLFTIAAAGRAPVKGDFRRWVAALKPQTIFASRATPIH